MPPLYRIVSEAIRQHSETKNKPLPLPKKTHIDIHYTLSGKWIINCFLCVTNVFFKTFSVILSTQQALSYLIYFTKQFPMGTSQNIWNTKVTFRWECFQMCHSLSKFPHFITNTHWTLFSKVILLIMKYLETGQHLGPYNQLLLKPCKALTLFLSEPFPSLPFVITFVSTRWSDLTLM